jgi:hypothetical protein
MDCVKNLFTLKDNNILIDGACAVEIYTLRVKIRSFIHKVMEEERFSVSEAVCFQCQVSKRRSV